MYKLLMGLFGKSTLLCCLLLLSSWMRGQQHFTGQIKDIVTLKPIGLATLVHGESHYSFADSYGYFEVVSPDKSVLHIRAKGYQEQLITLHAAQKFYTILLAPQPYQAAANTSGTAIIQQVIRAKNQNNPFVKIPAFDCKAYNKLTITAHPDSIEGRVESVLKHNIFGKMVVKTDSVTTNLRSSLANNTCFSPRKFLPINMPPIGSKKPSWAIKWRGLISRFTSLFRCNCSPIPFTIPTMC